MDDQDHTSSRPSPTDQRTEPVRSRWTPKSEQILILESIFNSGMVNPPKDETVRIRKLLEKFGPVGDANVFYWFQNRRSRSRRRQRQIQASLSSGEQSSGGYYGGNNSSLGYSYAMNMTTNGSSSSLCGLGGNGCACDDYFSFTGHCGVEDSLDFRTSDCSSLHYQSELITVFINGVATEVGRGPLDMKAMFGGDFVLFNEYGFLVQSLQHGENYFLVPKHS